MFVMFPLNKSLYKDFSSTPWQGNQLTIDKSQFTIKNLKVTICRVYNNPSAYPLGRKDNR